MSLKDKKEQAAKPLRFDRRMAIDVERLAKKTGRSQNDIIIAAIRKFLYENRDIFFEDMLEEHLLKRLDYEIELMHEQYDRHFGCVYLQIFKTEEPNIYKTHIEVKNSYTELILDEEKTLDITSKEEWNSFKERLVAVCNKYIDIDSKDIKVFFLDKFTYD